MKYIKIFNSNNIDTKAFFLLGASTKRDDDSKIGFFGSGLKYALAVLLRNNIDFKIYSNGKEIKIKTKKEMFRGVEFNSISIDNRRTSLTIEMGIDWEPWFAVREIYCNALDEENCSFDLVDEIEEPSQGTAFFIRIDDSVKVLLDNWNNYFSNKRQDLIFEHNGNKLFYGKESSRIVYRKGVQCLSDGLNSVFHYDFKDGIEINEARTIKDSWYFFYNMPQFFGAHLNIEALTILLENINKGFEKNFYWDNCTFFNNNWLSLVKNKQLIPANYAGYFTKGFNREDYLILPDKLVFTLKKFFKDKIKVSGFLADADAEYVVVEPSNKQLFILNESLSFLKEANFPINSEIKIAIFKEHKTLGAARGKKIILSDRVLELGKKQVVATLLEEQFHLESRANDETREFQNFLVGKLITLLEEKTACFL